MPPIIDQFYVYEETLSGDDPTIQTEYFVLGTSDESIVRELALNEANIPTQLNGLFLQTRTISYEGGNFWRIKTPYTKDLPTEVGKKTLNIDASAGTVHIVQSREVIESHAINPDGTDAAPPDLANGIGYSDGKFEGTDIPAAEFAFTITKLYAVGDVGSDYLVKLFKLCRPAHVNDAVFSIEYKGLILEFQPGELAFVGYTYTDVGTDRFEIAHRFKAIPNQNTAENNLGRIGGIPSGPDQYISKRGWDLLDVGYREMPSGVGTLPTITRVPAWVFVHRVLPDGDFSFMSL